MAQQENNNWKPKFLIMGALVGAAVGLATAYFMTRAAEENSAGPPQIQTLDALKAGVNIVGVMRGIAALAKR